MLKETHITFCNNKYSPYKSDNHARYHIFFGFTCLYPHKIQIEIIGISASIMEATITPDFPINI